MATILTHNVVGTPSVKGDQSTWHSAQSSNQENTANFAVRKPHHTGPRTPLSSGSELGNINQQYSQGISPDEFDSPLHLYGAAGARNLNRPLTKEDEIPENMYRMEDYDPYTEKWIHRDKLARIESQELQAAGYNLAKQTGSTTRRAKSADRLREAFNRADQSGSSGLQKEKRQPSVSSPMEEVEEYPEQQNWDLRNPDEIAATDSPRGERNHGGVVVRKTGSKIPLLTTSPLPIPPQRLDRDTPIPRKRTTSGSIQDDDTPTSSRSRRRKGSMAGPHLHEDAESNGGTPTSIAALRSGSKSMSPMIPTTTKSSTKAETTTTTPPAPDTLRVAAASTSPLNAPRKVTPVAHKKTYNVHKPRVPSDSSAGAPPLQPQANIRSGESERPKTAVSRLEGDAPWIATMYKPDPRLPPDQQIIPTHAKKQLQQHQYQQHQQQWAERSIRGSSLPQARPDSSSNSSNHRGPSSPRFDSADENRHLHHLSPPITSGPRPDSKTGAVPGKSTPNGIGISNPNRPGTSHSASGGSVTGNYSTIPKLSPVSHHSPISVSSPLAGQRGRSVGGGGIGLSPMLQQHRHPSFGVNAGATGGAKEGDGAWDSREGKTEKRKGGARCTGCCIVM